MKSFFAAIGLAALAVAVTVAQAPQRQPPTYAANQGVKGGGALPTGWQMRLDAAQDKPDAVRFMPMGTGFHVMTGPAGIFYRSDAPKSGTYEVQATFTQMEATPHGEAYGLFIGGTDLQSANQKYTYFLVRQDGRFLVKRRDGASTPTITDWTPHASVKKTEGSTRGTNALTIAVAPDKVRFLVNGTEVTSAAANRVDTKGIAGLRINHELNVHIEGFGVK
jgi:hypothetical protein